VSEPNPKQEAPTADGTGHVPCLLPTLVMVVVLGIGALWPRGGRRMFTDMVRKSGLCKREGQQEVGGDEAGSNHVVHPFVARCSAADERPPDLYTHFVERLVAAGCALWLAVALDAAVRSADSTCGHYLLSQRFTGPMHPHGSIVCGDARLHSEVSQASIVQIDCLNGVAVFRFHILQQRRNTLANLTLEEFIGFLVILQMCDELFRNAFCRYTLAVIIDDGVAKYAIEPGDDTFFVAD